MTQGRQPIWFKASELDVACWCGDKMRRFPLADIWDGTAGWSCGKPTCTEAPA